LRIEVAQEACQRWKPSFSKKMEMCDAQLLLDRRRAAQNLRAWNFIL